MNDHSPIAGQLVQVLREARRAQGISQRELAERAGVHQTHLARLEMGRLNPSASTLMQLARILDLELVLVPRRVLPAVQSLTRQDPARGPGAGRRSVGGTPIRVLRRIQRLLVAMESEHHSSKELTQAKNTVQALVDSRSTLDDFTLRPLRRIARWLALAQANKEQTKPHLAQAVAQLQELQQKLAAFAGLERQPKSQRAAYSLEDEADLEITALT